MRTFDTGATRDNDADKPDYEGYLSPLVIERYGRYMTKHRRQADGTVRASDNWQKGIPQDVYLKSLFRHLVDVWTMHRSTSSISKEELEDALCAILFNAMGYLFETLRLGQENQFVPTPMYFPPGPSHCNIPCSGGGDVAPRATGEAPVFKLFTCTVSGCYWKGSVKISDDFPGLACCPTCGGRVISSENQP